MSARKLLALLALLALVVGAVFLVGSGPDPGREPVDDATVPGADRPVATPPAPVPAGPGAATEAAAVEAPGADVGPAGRVSATARAYWRTSDYLAFIDDHLEAALAGDPEAQYFVAMAQQACAPAVAYPTLTGNPAAIEAYIARRPGFSDEQAALFRLRLGRCARFAEAYRGEDEAEAVEEGAEALLRASAAAGHPAARVELNMWTLPAWRDGPAREAVLDELATAAASDHPEALRRLADHIGGETGAILGLLACEAGYDCGPDALWVMEYCQLPGSVCRPGADGAEALLASMPGYEANAARSRVAALRGAGSSAYRALLESALAGRAPFQPE